MDDWMPIESAPKDGTRLLLVDTRSDRPRAFIGLWAENELTPSPVDWRDEFGWRVGVTHWQPLPTPPVSE